MKKRLHVALTALFLVCAVMLNFTACSGVLSFLEEGPGGFSATEAPGGSRDPLYEESDYPTIPVSLLSFSQENLSLSDTPEQTVELTVDALEGLDVEFRTDPNEGLKSYTVRDGVEVIFDTSVDRYNVIDAITVDDQIAIEQVYYQSQSPDGELSLDEIYAEYYSVEIDYREDGKIQGLYYLDHYYLYGYDAQGRMAKISRDGLDWMTLSYNALGKIAKETRVTHTGVMSRTYAYTEAGELYSVDQVPVEMPAVNSSESLTLDDVTFRWEGTTLSRVTGRLNGSFEYAYSFNGRSYLTRKTIDGITTRYAYLGDKVVGITRGQEQLYYILDSKLNYVGLKYGDSKYYFEVDPFGNVLGLIDCDGNVVVAYEFDVWGNLIGKTGEMADTLGELNEIVNLSALYDASLQAYFFADGLYIPASGVLLQADEQNGAGFTHTRSVYEWEQCAYFDRSAVTDFARIHDQVVRVALENLRERGLDVTGNLYAVDENGTPKRLVDIYTVDYGIVPFSAMNLLNGNQIYEVMYHAPDSMAFEALAEKKLRTISQELSVSYFADYKATPGTMKFNGQFIYLGYLIDYRCEGNGIVEYQVKINKKSNYDLTVNIYDYDQEQYVCYVNNTFDLNFLDGVTIIPGISQETFEVLDGYLGDYLQAVAGNICDQMLIYDDPAYYNMDQMNVMPDYWAQMNLPDTTQYLEIQADGRISVETIPAWQQDGFLTNIAIGAGVIAVTAVVATIAIAIPGANCVVVSICVGAAKGAATGALSGFAMGFIEPLVGIGIQGISTGNWNFNNYFNDALSAAARGFSAGAILGGITGGIQGGLKPTACFKAGTPVLTADGLVPIEDIKIGDMVWSYDHQTGETSLNAVLATSVRETNQTVLLEVGGDTIVTTPEHPFYVVHDDAYEGYVAARYLEVGDCILTADGGYQSITAITHEVLDEPIAVYNFTVEDDHSYYVGVSGVLVHNTSCVNPKFSEAGKGHTGRHEPRNLTEQLAMEQVKSNPSNGEWLKRINLGDERWSVKDGWVKMQQVVETANGKTTIHYVMNQALGLVDDFKFVN